MTVATCICHNRATTLLLLLLLLLLWFRCAPEDLSRERGALMEEWRMTQDSAGRQQVAHWKLLLEGAK
jgi:predicted Zn-dependent peptidase